MTFYQIAICFLIYSFLGWCIEVVYHALKIRKIINRGFLCGPVCPVYGFGAIAVFLLVRSPFITSLFRTESSWIEQDSISSLAILFLIGVVLATAVELFAGWILNVFFHARWWDYSREPLNFHGYICVKFSLLWGLAIVLVVRILQPIVEAGGLWSIPEKIGWPILGVAYAVMFVDLIVTVMIVAGLNKRLAELDKLQKQLKKPSDALSRKLGSDAMKAQTKVETSKVQATLGQYELRSRIEAKKKEILSSGRVFGARRLLNAFPEIQHRQFQESIEAVKNKNRTA